MTSPMRSKKSGVGFRFHPTDEELVDHYLTGKINGNDHDVDGNVLIPEIKVCDYEPWELPDLIKKDSNDEAWYLVSPCDYKYKNSSRFNRVTKAGFWKPTGKTRKVINKRTKRVIGTKKSLVFYKKQHPKPIRTSFIMHEYDIIDKSKGKSGFVLYKLKVKGDEKINVGGELVHQMPASPSDYTSQVTVNSSCEESETMITSIDFGNCIDYGYGDSEKDNHVGSDYENQIPDQMADGMSDLAKSVINVFEYQNKQVVKKVKNKQVTVNSSCEESEIMSTFIDCGKQNDEVEICIDYGYGDSEKDNHLGSNSENQSPNQMADYMSDRVRSEINDSEYQTKQDDALVSKGNSAAAKPDYMSQNGYETGSEVNESMPTFLESSQTCFDQLEALDGSEDCFNSALLSPWSYEDCLSFYYVQ